MPISPEVQSIIEACKEFAWLATIKKTVTTQSFAFHHMKTLIVEFFNTPNF